LVLLLGNKIDDIAIRSPGSPNLNAIHANIHKKLEVVANSVQTSTNAVDNFGKLVETLLVKQNSHPSPLKPSLGASRALDYRLAPMRRPIKTKK